MRRMVSTSNFIAKWLGRLETRRPLVLAFLAITLHSILGSSAVAQVCDTSVLGNALIGDPTKCRVRAIEQNGVVITLLKHGETKRIDPAKVPRCTAIGARLMKQMDVLQDDYISPTRMFISTFTFTSRCASVTLDCQVIDVSYPELNKAPWGSVATRCGANVDRVTAALQIIAPTAKQVVVRDFVSKCFAAAKAGKAEGPNDREDGAYMLICDPQSPSGPEVRIEAQ